MQLLAAVDAGEVDVLLVEDLSRLSRDVGDAAELRKRFAYRGVRVVGVADGVDSGRAGSSLLYGVRSVLGEAYLEDLADKTRRGMAGRALAGRVTGGLPYGYRSAPAPDGIGRFALIDEAQAREVRALFAAYAAGSSFGRIAADLNTRAVAPPRKGQGWQSSGVRAMLVNERYAGRWTWNTHAWGRDPATRKRRYRERPKEEWIVEEREDLRIVDETTWQAVCARFEARRMPDAPKRARRSYLLSGILRCGVCGAPMVITGARRYYACSTRRTRGRCGNRETVREPVARSRIVRAVCAELLRPEAIAAWREIAAEELARYAERFDGARVELEREQRRLQAQAERLVGAIADGLSSPTIRDRLDQVERQLAGIARQLRVRRPVALPELGEVVAHAQRLGERLEADVEQGREALRGLLEGGRIGLYPQPSGGLLARARLLSGAVLWPDALPETEGPREVPTGGCGGRI